MEFTKMHGLGNDFLIFEDDGTVTDWNALAEKLCCRRLSVGADGILVVLPSLYADIRMRIINADGSEAEMCGNGLRCVAKFAYDHRLVSAREITVETGGGVKTVQLEVNDRGRVERVRVNMGRPLLTRGEIPMTGDPAARVVGEALKIGDRTFEVTCVSMGNPHCVIFVEDVAQFPVATYGPLIERHPWFPRRTNVEFVEVLAADRLRQRTWERGAGETLACGTGASAVTVAGVLTGRTGRQVQIHLRGGDLELDWSAGGDLFMTGPAVQICEGEYDPQ